MAEVDAGAEEGDDVEVDRNGLEILDRAECLHLLGGATLGRIGVTYGALPTILPINFRLVEERIVFRTGEFRLRDFTRRPQVDGTWLTDRIPGADVMQPTTRYDLDNVFL